MDASTVTAFLKVLAGMSPTMLFWLIILIVGTPFGVVLLVLVFYWSNERRQSELLRVYREDTAKLSKFYESNVELVKAWQMIAEGFQDTVVLNSQTMQRMIDVCLSNQFCPNARLPK